MRDSSRLVVQNILKEEFIENLDGEREGGVTKIGLEIAEGR